MKGLENYVTVNERIVAFYEKFPEGSIQSEILFPDENTVRCKAYAYRSPADCRPGIGHAEERRDQGMVNKTSAVENAETSSWGRALAALGFEVQRGVASREEVEIARRKADGQKNPSEAATGPENVPERYADYLRLAIRSYDQNQLINKAAFRELVDSAKTKEAKEKLVLGLEAALEEAGGNPEMVRSRWNELQVAKG